MTFNDTTQVVPFRCSIYLDWLNIKMNGGRDINFDRLFDHIRSRGGMIRTANFYAPEPENTQIPFYDAVTRAGFKIVYIHEKGRAGRGQFNCDTLMAVDMVTQTEGLDAVYLLTNDYDFIHPVRYLRAKGIRTMLIHVEYPSNDLREEVDEWKHAGQLNLLLNGRDTSKEIL